MGLYIRKSVSVGPVRFNLSKSGLGLSVGVPGFRIGMGPRGKYLHMGRGGVYYRQSIGSHPLVRRPAPAPPLPPAAVAVAAHGPAAEVPAPAADEAPRVSTSRPASLFPQTAGDGPRRNLVRSELNAAILYRRRLGAVVLLVLVVGTAVAWWAASSPIGLDLLRSRDGAYGYLLLLLAVAALVATAHRDHVHSRAVIHFDEDAPETVRLSALRTAMAHLRACPGLWEVTSQEAARGVSSWAGATVGRVAVSGPAEGLPPATVCNLLLPCLALTSRELFFLPDQLLVFSRDASPPFTSISYGRLAGYVERVRVMETGALPHDAKVVGQSYPHVTRDGHPDHRFGDNPELPIVEYGELTLMADDARVLGMQCSDAPAADALLDALAAMGVVRSGGGA